MLEPLSSFLLVAHDQEAERNAIAQVLEQAGFPVRCAGNIAETRRLAAAGADLVLVSIQIGGLDLCRQLKSDPVTAQRPLILLTEEDAINIAADCSDAVL